MRKTKFEEELKDFCNNFCVVSILKTEMKRKQSKDIFQVSTTTFPNFSRIPNGFWERVGKNF